MNLNDYIHLAVAKEAQDLLRREPGEATHAFDRRLDNYIHRRMKQLAATLIALDAERAAPEVA
jgi:hypothetical protein